ncbi:membrane protein [Trichophyton mentagrophytes]|nr:membrane protein [Trichophyton mentagrophytes]
MSREGVESKASSVSPVDGRQGFLEPRKLHVPETVLGGTRRWNTGNLGSRLAVDVVSAATAGALICPMITIIDKSIIEKAAKGISIQSSLASSLKGMITKPHRFLTSTPFLLIYTLYSSTYLSANLIDTAVSTLEDKAYNNVSTGFMKFLTTAMVNMSICVYKDSRFVKIFGTQGQGNKPSSASVKGPTAAAAAAAVTPQIKVAAACLPQNAPKIPITSYGLFCFRDSITIFASFNLPPIVARYVPDAVASNPKSKYAIAQFAIPASIQLISTPFHLLGLDLYNRQPPGGLPAADRWARVKRDWVPSCIARIGRILPAYGVGGVVNTRMRERFMSSIDPGQRS